MTIHKSIAQEYHFQQRFEVSPSTTSLIATRNQGEQCP